jgi:metal-dependent amidase/aminoacylase/carboxypeptidase family protein
LHNTNIRAAGTASIVSEPTLASLDIHGCCVADIGVHAARPQEGKDPIVMAAELIVQLQTIVSRRENSADPAVVTIGNRISRPMSGSWAART